MVTLLPHLGGPLFPAGYRESPTGESRWPEREFLVRPREETFALDTRATSILEKEMNGVFGFSAPSSRSKRFILAPSVVIQKCQRQLAEGKEEAEWERTMGKVTLSNQGSSKHGLKPHKCAGSMST